MPMFKVPIGHDLGITVSTQPQKEALEKLLFKNAEKLRAAKQPTLASRNPFKINRQFILKYNQSYGSIQQEKYVERAMQLLCLSQRRAGLRSLGQGEHVDLPLAWAELLLLGLCHGHIQNDALDSLLMSLDHAPVEEDQISVLFYLAESLLSWITSDAALKDTFYSCEVKMIKLGYLVFLRLYLFHICGKLSPFPRSKGHLPHFLKALQQCELCYQPFPNLLFCVQLILQTGETICDLEALQNNHTDTDVQHLYELNPVLWHSLLGWHFVKNGLSEQLSLLAQNLLPDQTHQKNWVECALGLMVLGEAAKSSLQCLHMLMDLYGYHTQQEDHSQKEDKPLWPWQLIHVYSVVVAEVCLQGGSADIQKAALLGRQTDTPSSGGLITLLHAGREADWQHRYSAVQALQLVWRGLSGAALREEMRNYVLVTLKRHLSVETDQRVRDAVDVIEEELRVPGGSFRTGGAAAGNRKGGACCHDAGIPHRMIGRWLALTLSRVYRPSAPTKLPAVPESSQHPQRDRTPPRPETRPSTNKAPPPRPREESPDRNSRERRPISLRQTHRKTKGFTTRMESELTRVLEEQWQKELMTILAEEAEVEREKEERRQREEEEKHRKMMMRKTEKIKKDTKPYELPGHGGENHLIGQSEEEHDLSGQSGQQQHDLIGQSGEHRNRLENLEKKGS